MGLDQTKPYSGLRSFGLMEILTELNRGANDDVMVTDVTTRGELLSRIINIHD